MTVLDTHVWLWWLNQDSRLKTSWRECIAQADQVGVSAVSLFEVSWLERHERIELPCPQSPFFTAQDFNHFFTVATC